MNCWEFLQCGHQKGGINERKLGVCPAFPDYGRSCARVIGTLCGGAARGLFSEKIKRCRKCSFYNSQYYDMSDDGVNLLIITKSELVSRNTFPR
ncbi:MAG: two-CW domain-containing protein [Pseudomonadota bacterium]